LKNYVYETQQNDRIMKRIRRKRSWSHDSYLWDCFIQNLLFLKLNF